MPIIQVNPNVGVVQPFDVDPVERELPGTLQPRTVERFAFRSEPLQSSWCPWIDAFYDHEVE